ncbi:MAG: hypothetical protein AAF196_09370 [Planctomycetota bacterium]
MRRFTSLALVPLLALVACASPSAWRSADVSPEDPRPTLILSSAFYFAFDTTEVDLTGVDFGSRFRTWEEAADDGSLTGQDEVTEIKAVVGDERVGKAQVAQIGPDLHDAITELLESQGFVTHTDSSLVTEALTPHHGRSPAWCAPETVPIALDRSVEIAKDLRVQSPREAFASIEGEFVSTSPDLTEGIRCVLRVRVFDQEARLLFHAESTGNSRPSITRAFDSAFERIRQPVVRR